MKNTLTSVFSLRFAVSSLQSVRGLRFAAGRVRYSKLLATLVYVILFLLLLTLLPHHARAQTNAPITLSSSGTTGTYISNQSITLSTGFSSSGPFSALIQSVDCIPLTTTPTLTQNYVITNTPRFAGFTNENQLGGQTTCMLMQAIQYADGLGRPIQSIQVMASPFGNDMITPQAYDQYGREVTKYLPYTPYSGTPGSFRPNAVTNDQGAFYTNPPAGVTTMANPYAQTNFDNSPLNRPVEAGAPGAAWQLSTSGVAGSGHTVKMVYTLNNATSFASDSINGRQAAMYYTVINSDMSQTLYANGYYAANELTVTVTKDENWQIGRAGTVEEYKDIDGHVVLKRVYNYAGGVVQMLSTYYVYDDLGRLAFVLPPSSGADAATTISTTTLNNLCYQYQYDERGRPMQKMIPGKGWEYTIFNTMDQPVATQDPNQRASNQWIFTKYDAQGRVVMSGIWNNGNAAVSRASLQTTLTGISTNLYEAATNTGNGYTNVAWPTSSVTATLSINYYDGYSNIPNLPTTYSAPGGADLGTRGLLTASLTAILNTPTNMLWDVHYYDYWGRSMKFYAQHYLAGTLNNSNYDVTSTTYNFNNQPTTVTRAHWNTSSTTYPLVTIANQYIYDHVGRKLKSWEQVTNTNSSPTTRTLLSQMVFNEVGQALTKQLHSTDSVNFFQQIAYTYNERGWLLGSSAPLFAMQLYYNTGTNKQYNGNIAYQYFGTAGNLSNHYTYTYDKLNRLMGAVSVDNNNETGIAYDLEGNITALNRYTAGTLTDQLSYTYNGTNQLQSISDASGSNTGIKSGTSAYTYDSNGNVTADQTRSNGNIGISNNLLNLPQTITGGRTITYTYDATGNKLRRVSSGTGNTDYINGIEYDGTGTETLSFIQTEEGKAVPSGSTYIYNYYLGDNLGNTRITFDTHTTTPTVVQQDDYYAFGMEINRSVTSPKNEYLYNKKELQEETGLYDYGARFYDPLIGRWTSVDPLAEISRRWSPYNYVENNPIRMTDPDGMKQETPEEIQADENRWASEKEGFEEAKTGNISIGGNGGDNPTVNAEVRQATELSKKYSVNEAGELVENTLDVISFLEKLTSTFLLVLTPQQMGTGDVPSFEQSQNRYDDATDIQQYNSKSGKTDQDEPQRKYLTYIKVRSNADGSITTYSGRTSGNINESDAAILKRRDASHHMKGFGPAVKDESSTNKYAIRGREQQLIDYFGGAQSDRGTSGNAIRGVYKGHPLGKIYHVASSAAFGQLYKYTGN